VVGAICWIPVEFFTPGLRLAGSIMLHEPKAAGALSAAAKWCKKEGEQIKRAPTKGKLNNSIRSAIE
jgi:hypothetical protein